MCTKDAKQLTLDSDTFKNLKDDFDGMLARILKDMDKRNVDDATITLKLSVSLDREKVGPFTSDDEAKEVVKPTFKHDISSVMQVKDKKSGSVSGDFILVWDEEEGEFVMKRITNGQMSFDTMDEPMETERIEYVDAIPALDEAPAPALLESAESSTDDITTPFGWLKQFVGQSLYISEAMGNYTVRTTDDKVVLSSASTPTNVFFCSAEKLAPHVGHNVVCVGYGGEVLNNISIECEDCFDVLFSLESDSKDASDDADIVYIEPDDVVDVESDDIVDAEACLEEDTADEDSGEYEYSEPDDDF